MRSRKDRATETVVLRDGSEVLVRPVDPQDKERLRVAFEALSDESRYRRFLAPKPRLTTSELRYLTEVDHHDHEALIALDPHTAAVLGVARYIRAQDDAAAAEAAVVVSDEWQGRGLGRVLMRRLTDSARASGVRVFRALVLTHNQKALRLLDQFGPVRVDTQEPGTVTVEAKLPPRRLGRALARLVRAAPRRAVLA